MITRIVEIGEGRGAGRKFQNKRFVDTATRTFRLTTDEKHDEWFVLLNCHTVTTNTPNPVPDYFDAHPSRAGLTVKSIDPRQEDLDGRSWLLTVGYDDESIDQSDPDPLTRNVKYRLEWNRVSKDMVIDQDGVLVLNTVGDPFEDGVPSSEARPVLIATKNYPADQLDDVIALAIDYIDSYNTDTFHGATAGHALCRNIVTGDLQSENDTDYYAVTHEFEFKSDDALLAATGAGVVQFESSPKPWSRIVLNRGFNANKVEDELLKKYPLPQKEAQKLRAGGTVWTAGAAGGFYRVFREFKERPFSALGV